MPIHSSIPGDEADQTREKFVAAIKCKCGQTGSVAWEENTMPSPKGSKPALLSVSGGFYIRLLKKDIGRTEIICAMCESVVPA